MSLFKDFREFVGTGNAMDLAVGVLVGSAIGGILKSFVDELIVPLTGLLGKQDFSNAYLVLKGDVAAGMPLAEARKVNGAVILGYGQFATVAINTLVLAFVVFLVVRAIRRLKAPAEAPAAAPAEPPPPAADIVLLTEIRDLLKK